MPYLYLVANNDTILWYMNWIAWQLKKDIEERKI